jgi:hypothetical protein
MPIILATWEAEIRRILVQSQPGQKMFARPHLNGKKLGMMTCACHPGDRGRHKIGGSQFRLA